MSFFSANATFGSGGGDFEVAEAGNYTCRLNEVERKEGTDYNDPSKAKTDFVWKFETTKDFDSKDRPYRFFKYTGTAYGNDKANLTLHLDGMLGKRLTREEFANLDLDALKEQEWNVLVTEHTTQSGKDTNKVVSVKPASKRGVSVDAPLKPTPKPVKAEVSEDDEDPFA
jgi:hypothetical protein